jgi:hypothetical protein
MAETTSKGKIKPEPEPVHGASASASEIIAQLESRDSVPLLEDIESMEAIEHPPLPQPLCKSWKSHLHLKL